MKYIYPLVGAVAAVMCIASCAQSSKHTKGHSMTEQTLASGLHYKTLTPGTGAQPQKGKRVTVHYTGWLNDNGMPGKKFDSSVDRGTPFTFTIGVGQVIAGWDEGVARMHVGEKARLTIPANLGYGARGAGGAIPPHATLIFDVELISIS
jgi:peptidylprolyl isomerase